jgi:SAM-dependent methyltransferase
MYDVDYKKWADYVENIFSLNGIKPSLVLDLGCGTGNFCIELAKRGYDMIGADISGDMLSCAKEKSLKEDLDILYVNQDITDFELYGTVDAIVCLMDTVNYLTDKRGVKKLFKLVSNYLNPGGLFIFDINSEYKFKNLLGDNVYYEVDEEITYIWQNRFDRTKKICEFDLTFFIKNNEEKYERCDETHYERAYSVGDMEQFIKKENMVLLNKYNELTFEKPSKTAQRIFFVCRK